MGAPKPVEMPSPADTFAALEALAQLFERIGHDQIGLSERIRSGSLTDDDRVRLLRAIKILAEVLDDDEQEGG